MWTVARGIDGTPPGSLQAEAFKRVGSIKREMTFTFQAEDVRRDSSKKVSHQHLFPLAMEEDVKTTDTKKASRALDHEKENTRSICLLEQKRKVVSSNIDVPPASVAAILAAQMTTQREDSAAGARAASLHRVRKCAGGGGRSRFWSRGLQGAMFPMDRLGLLLGLWFPG
nr:PREDICTED: uncharacterized protein LOC103557803 isoform X1 [Equus przewalskii]